MKTVCLSCDATIELDTRVSKGDFVSCIFCGDEFEVISTDPIKLVWADNYEDFDDYEDDEDWDYDDDEGDDDEDY
ncbi:MAG: hypothetical protein JXA19_03275 [Anaerolineales bacterium]|nr:hypothetical protein [Anaerolineales bacterium]